MFLDMRGRTALLAGGDEQIAQKSRLLTRTEADLVIMSETLIPELQRLVDQGQARHVAADCDAGVISASRFVFIATGDDELDQKIADHARAAGAIVNMVDKPDQCDMITPALVDRDPVVVAIGTEGAAPVLAKAIKTSLEQSLSPRLGGFIDMIRLQRGAVAEQVDRRARLPFWNWAIKGAPWRKWLEGDEAGAEAMVRAAAQAGGPPTGEPGGLTFIEAPAAPDLLSLRAVERLQNAAVVFHSETLDDSVLELARRDAERVALSECPRHDPAEVEKALMQGAVVVIATANCAWPAMDAEAIRAAPA